MSAKAIVEGSVTKEQPSKVKGAKVKTSNGEGKPDKPNGHDCIADGDIFDNLDSLLVPQNVDLRAGGRKQVSVTVGKPGRAQFVRVHPGWAATAEFLEFDGGDRRTLYLALPGLLRDLEEEAKLSVSRMTLRLYVDRDVNVGLWPLRIGDTDNTYVSSAWAAAEEAESRWIRIKSNQVDRCYDVHIAMNQVIYGEPQWPELTQSEILRLAFREKLISSPDHPVIRRLLGAI